MYNNINYIRDDIMFEINYDNFLYYKMQFCFNATYTQI